MSFSCAWCYAVFSSQEAMGYNRIGTDELCNACGQFHIQTVLHHNDPSWINDQLDQGLATQRPGYWKKVIAARKSGNNTDSLYSVTLGKRK